MGARKQSHTTPTETLITALTIVPLPHTGTSADKVTIPQAPTVSQYSGCSTYASRLASGKLIITVVASGMILNVTVQDNECSASTAH